MNLSERDRRALVLLGIALLITAAVYYWPQSSPDVAAAANDTQTVAARLDRLRREAQLLPTRTELLAKASAELGSMEKGLIPADSAAQAQAQLLQVVRRIARTQSPPLDFRAADFMPLRPYGANYAQVGTNLMIECQIDQLVNFMADIASAPELLATEELHITSIAASKQKAISVRLLVTGLTSAALLKPRTGGAL